MRAVRRLVEELVSIDSVNPTLVPGGAGELEVARYIAGWLERHALDVELHELEPGRANVVARARGTSGGRSLMLNGHTDTVGVGRMVDGLVPRVDGARLYGRGAQDMKGSLAAVMLAAAEAKRLRLQGDLIVAAVADEEARSIGTEAVAGSVQADAAIVVEPTDLQPAVAHRGFVWLEAETHGVAAHGSRYDVGVDAIARMGRVLVGIDELDRALRSSGEPDPLLGAASVHASTIEGGRELSTYPDRCLLKLERRTMPGETADAVEQELQALAEPVGGSVRRVFVREPLATSPDEPIVRILSEAAEARGVGGPPVGVPFWTDAALLSAAGIPSVIFGPRGAGLHSDVEWVDLESVALLADVLLETVVRFCGR